MKYLPILLIFLISCKQETKTLSAQQIIDKAIENAGGSKFENADIQFTFRNVTYTNQRKNGLFEFTRSFTDSLGEVKDVLNNSGFERFINSEKIVLADSTAEKYSNSLNSVHYFVQLPYGLNDAAVQKELVGETKIKGKEYYMTKVTFSQDGGGTDHDDVYMYWINKEDFHIDYFAYKFYTGEGGIRFREAYNPRQIEGLRFVDYKNYKIEPWESVDLKDLGERFESGKLELLSDIKTENILVDGSINN
ncbi:deoxyribose-phosphate aldolase [Aequorivita sp. H23M31]|uniref:Deoxyribose-phosphate aldolase n=1 Tax=Aequorivita ciconiae TaxID=2494375 RepID=A0A410G5S1_9FLAO|nr:DUF6503 family protein [Aequorivita sp. H23M31]QAA82638.1 deoxyribose-phosphate aldolase [Aequorivita sp. H23M31]